MAKGGGMAAEVAGTELGRKIGEESGTGLRSWAVDVERCC